MASNAIKYDTVTIECSCGSKFETRSTLAEKKSIVKIEVCSKCHPYYTGKNKIMDTEGKIKQFMRRHSSYSASQAGGKSEDTDK